MGGHQGEMKHCWVLVLMIQEACDICRYFPHFDHRVPGYPESAEVPAEEEGRAGKTAANIRCPELQGHFLWRAGGLL